jgi:hypothetical protein
MMVGVSISDEQLGGIADRAIMDAGCGQEQMISFEDLKKVQKSYNTSLKSSLVC